MFAYLYSRKYMYLDFGLFNVFYEKSLGSDIFFCFVYVMEDERFLRVGCLTCFSLTSPGLFCFFIM